MSSQRRPHLPLSPTDSGRLSSRRLLRYLPHPSTQDPDPVVPQLRVGDSQSGNFDGQNSFPYPARNRRPLDHIDICQAQDLETGTV